ncbi:MAG TPA: phosphatase PAP2 family protein [Candidatus Parcubacteria bacterium]|nr:phosphatase PAP2 family protein [Candidatus Parcubacteria bacterium]
MDILSFLNSWDLEIFHFFNWTAGLFPFFDYFAVFCAKYLGYFLIVALLLLLIKKREKCQAMVFQALFAALFSRLVIVNLIRWVFPRARPFVASKVNLLFSHNAGESSFPSGHAAFYFALSAVVYHYNKKAGLLFYFASFLIGFFRVFAGVHWPSDIAAGILVGLFSGWLFIFLSQKISPNTLEGK